MISSAFNKTHHWSWKSTKVLITSWDNKISLRKSQDTRLDIIENSVAIYLKDDVMDTKRAHHRFIYSPCICFFGIWKTWLKNVSLSKISDLGFPRKEIHLKRKILTMLRIFSIRIKLLQKSSVYPKKRQRFRLQIWMLFVVCN